MARLHGAGVPTRPARARVVPGQLAPTTQRSRPRGDGVRLARTGLTWQDSRRQAAADRGIRLRKWQDMPKDEPIMPAHGCLDELAEVVGRLSEIMESVASAIQVMINDVFVEYVTPSRDARAAAMRVPDDAPPPVVVGEPPRVHDWNGRQVVFWGGENGSARTPDDAPTLRPLTGEWTMRVESPAEATLRTLFGLDPHGRIDCPTNLTISWPDEGYPCQLCWAAGRWPWEPARVCPLTVPVESTYCARHAKG